MLSFRVAPGQEPDELYAAVEPVLKAGAAGYLRKDETTKPALTTTFAPAA